MDIEQLKLILETVNSAGEGTFYLAVALISKLYLEIVIDAICVISIFWIIYKGAIYALACFSFGNQVADLLDETILYSTCRERALKKIKEWKSNSEQLSKKTQTLSELEDELNRKIREQEREKPIVSTE